ncbi:MAG: hypothetical protein KBD53_09770 [Candidatus Omnitrophica bacterium]|nr:hypothetical protein [Candidatus Omnitrophota bacterium]
MFKDMKKFSLILALLAIFSFVAISIGGEFLHSKIHHHQTQPSHDKCFISQLQAQLLILFVTLLAVLFTKVISFSIVLYQIIIPSSHFNLPSLRAPPVSL